MTATAGAVAIVGIGCRFPGGADSPLRYWELLARGGDAIVDAPPDRNDLHALYDPDPKRPGGVYVRRGGYLDAIDRFDAGFFGISPREARRIDPQQRLLLEVAWEALEDGGLPADGLAGSRTGVFVGISGHDYADMQSWPGSRKEIDGHVVGGGATSIAANRISYALDLRGPSMTVDTACSSALTAVHLACRSLAAGECDLALAGAVNALITSEPTIGFCKAQMLAPDGRCKPFDAAADGYGRGEGAGVLALKPLARALADGDPIHAVIRATAINQDGRTKGLSVPSPEAQEALLREALHAAGLRPGDVQVVEAHGTGTPVGDPREALAIGRVLGGRPAGAACVVGSAKGNLGHLEAAAGIAGLIKAALALQRRAVPPSINFERPNPAIDFDGLGLRVPVALEPWPAPPGVPARAGVNSFGFGGANAHAIVEQPPPAPAPETAPGDEPGLLALSARSPAALRELAARCAGWLRERDADPRDACFTAAVRRSHHEHRLAAVGATAHELAGRLDAFAAGERHAAVATGRAAARDRAPQVAFVFSGMGPQWWGMGRELLRDEPVFAAAIDECDELLRPLSRWSLRAELERGEADSRIAEPYLAHVANVALQVGLAALWRSWGIVPDAVVGHSSGEAGAACVAGVLTLHDALALAFHRGRLQQRAAGSGGMLAAAIAPGDVARLLDGYEERVSLAAVNAPASLTLSGDLAALAEIAGELARGGGRGRLLDVSVPYHGPQMDALREELLQALDGLQPRAPAIPFASTVTGGWLNGEPLDARYWWRNVRRPVRFADAIGRLADRGCEVFVELSPHPVLAPAVAACLEADARETTVLASLRRGARERETMLRALAALHVRGSRVRWPGVLRGGRCVRMPTYPWQRERHWAQPPPPAVAPQGADTGHPLLGRRVRGARAAWEAQLDDERLAFLEGHRVQQRVTFPGAGHVELALAAARALAGDGDGAGPLALDDVAFERLLGLGEGGAQLLGCVAAERLEIHSAPADEPDAWTLRASARPAPAPPQAPPRLDVPALRARCSRPVDVGELYASIDERHAIAYTGAFRAVRRMWSGDGEALAELELPAGVDADGWNIHPALLDAAFQVLGGTALGSAGSALLPVAIAHVALHAPPGRRCLVHAELGARDADAVQGTVTLAGDDGRVLLRCERLRLRELGAAAGDAPADWLYEERWEPARAAASSAGALAAQVTAAAAAGLRAHAVEAGFASYYATIEPALDALARGHVRAALEELGFDAARDGALTAGELGERLGVAPARRRQLARLLALASAPDPAPAPDPVQLVAAHPAYASAVELVGESGRRLAATLRDVDDARDWLVAGAARQTLGELYAVCPGFAVYGVGVAEAVAAAAGARPSGSLRILEVGAGTGGATGHILERLPAPPGEYVFSDLSPFFLRAANARFAGRPELRTAIIDIEDPPADETGFDVVVAADVVHATADVGRALANLRAMLAPGGVLILLEAARRSAWLDLVFGQLEGWWRAGDRDHPLLPPERWVELLGAAGFADAVAVSDDAAQPAQAVIIAGAPAPARERRRRLVLTDTAVGPQLAAQLRERGDDCVLAWPGASYAEFGPEAFELDPADPAHWTRLLELAGPIDAIVDLWALDSPGPRASGEELLAFQRTTCGAIVALTQALAALGRTLPPACLVTAGAQALAAGDDAGFAQAPLWGVGRVLRTERGSGRCRLVDIGSQRAAADVDALLAELDAPPRPGEDEVALRDGQRLVRRLLPAALPPQRDRATVSPDEASFRAGIARPGTLESLCLRAESRAAPGVGEVEIRVIAAALNFRDVLVALGVGFAAGGEDPARAAFGWECAGVVEACGEGVDGFAPGDEVIAIAAGALGSRVITRAAHVVRKPTALSFEQAATLPVGFLTARWGLERMARLAAGERVLIHCASGGVGLAAVQIARRAGAEVLATAGTADKRAHLRALGIEHVMDSRTLRFADEVRAATGGEGVDVVLNSLTGEAIDRSLEILRPFGRFVEIGKRAIYEGGRLVLAPFRNNLSYFALDLHPLYAEQPEVIGAMLREIVADVERGELEPLAHHAYDLAALEPAFRLMAQARHIGKVVVTVREPAYDVVPASAPAPLLRADGAYVITGGLGGFGLQVAQWMVREGAGHVVLAGRSGAPRDEDLPALEALLAMDADVHVVRADVCDASATARLLAHVRESIAPLRGVVHAAMVLDDALLGVLDYPRFETALAPKLAGAWNLHALTAGDELDLFVSFSSISLLIGQPSQAGYAAGNAFLAALGAHRRARGLPALTIDWGTIVGAGYVARQPGLEARLRRAGLPGISAADACAMLGELLRSDVARMAVSSIDWGADEAAAAAAAPERPADARAAPHGLRARLRAASHGERAGLVEDYLRATTAVVLETSADRVDVDRPLPDMGIDSLMAIELRTAMRAELGVEVPIVDLLERFSLRGLAAAVAERAGA